MATCVATLRGHGSWVKSVAFHPTLPLLATGLDNRTTELWRFLADGSEATNMSATCEAILRGHGNSVSSVAFHSKLPLLATGSKDKTVKLWSFNPHGLAVDNMLATCVATLEGRHGHTGAVTSLAFHSKLPLLATTSWDDTAKLWSFNPQGTKAANMSATCVATLGGWGRPDGHDKWVNSVAFHPTLPLLVTGSFDNTAKLWRCIKPYNDFNLFSKKGDISEDICNSLCYLCNFKLCNKNSSNDNNSNGYVVKLTNGDLTKDIHVHYNCLHFQLTTNKTEIDNIPISTDTIQRILNIDCKMDALIGTDFYN
jgi:WD40 repeat protein